ncbi:hypothetical protein TVAG_250380 [Trichomonas vaginalis G3]|uniref:MIF4G-like type 2 domain-containing protein n=1 Tax=Trichomonas vaginalis (strain ATCC PRA-98 / G3) TaxID=412133 RepID=A2DCP1_TRIV3|nr:pre-mRNA 5' cap binding protein family [Trichomonas vaginalis G3]EAY21978.1 hypothetical protein TVAG_250380 [Trichomonas vaginalis G3]KAI5487533.1 pre-mRNA 5' cap binding protein family [Trichomonas vaginalis G3]|eukprot:XP_001582964.1 hypothetical protein [Trichomonas vaginalis G3]
MEETDAQAQPKLDDLGRIIPETEENKEAPVENPVRHLIDANIKIEDFESEPIDIKKSAAELARYLVKSMSPRQKLSSELVKQIGGKIFTAATQPRLIKQVAMDSIATNPISPSTLAAIIGFYTIEYADATKRTIINDLIPQAISKAFTEDNYTTVKRFLIFLSCFISYNFVTKESFIALLNDLAAKLDEASDFRRDAISRIILFICRTAPEEIDDESLNGIISKVRPFVEDTTFISRYKQTEDSQSISQLLLQMPVTPRFDFHTSDYAELFKARSSPIDIPKIEFTFGEHDLAPPPVMCLNIYQSDIETFPVLLDTCFDIITFLSPDLQAMVDMLFTLPLLDHNAELYAEQIDFGADEYRHYVEAIFTAILSDMTRIPRSAYPLAFHASLITSLLTDRPELIEIYQSIVDKLVNNLSLDFCLFRRIVLVLSHAFCNIGKSQLRVPPLRWDDWKGAAQIESNSDARKLFIQSFMEHVSLFGNWEVIKKDVPEEFYNLVYNTNQGEPDNDIKTLHTKIETAMEEVEKYITENTAKIGEAGTLALLLKAIFMGITSGEAAIKTIKLQNNLIMDYFKSDTQDWRAQQLVDTVYNIFKAQPTVLSQVIVYFINYDYVRDKDFFDWLFEETDEAKARLLIPTTWDVFQNVIDCISGCYEAEGRTEDMTEMLKLLFERVIELYNELSGAMIERLLNGNLKEFILGHTKAFAAAQVELRGLISDSTKAEFVQFFDKLALLCQ